MNSAFKIHHLTYSNEHFRIAARIAQIHLSYLPPTIPPTKLMHASLDHTHHAYSPPTDGAYT